MRKFSSFLLLAIGFTNLAHAEPKAVDEKVEKTRYAVLACYDDQKASCDALRKKLTTQCEPKVTLIETPLNGTPDEAAKAIAKKVKDGILPDGTPVFIVAHGMEPKKFTLPHLLSTGNVDSSVDTANLMTAIQKPGGKPAFWVNACFGGMACDNTSGFCVGAVCQKNELSVKYEGNLNPGTAAMAELYCNKDKFDLADTNRDGTLDDKELNANFCDRVPHGRPYTKFVPPGKGDVRKENIAKTKEIFGLLLEKHLAEKGDGDFNADKRKRLLELSTELDKKFIVRREVIQKYNDEVDAWNKESKKLTQPAIDDVNSAVNKYNALVKKANAEKSGSDERKKLEIELGKVEKDLETKEKTLQTARAKLPPTPKVPTLPEAEGFAGNKDSKDIAKAVKALVALTSFKGSPDKALWHEEEISGESNLLVDLPEKKAKACLYIGDAESVPSYYQPNFRKFSFRFYPGTKAEAEGDKKPDVENHAVEKPEKK